MMDDVGPSFSRFNAATKCKQSLLMDPPELLLDRTASRRWSIPEPTREAMLLAVVAAATVVIGWHSYQHGETRQIEAQIAQLVAIQARQAELKRIVGSEEAQALQAADQAQAAVRR